MNTSTNLVSSDYKQRYKKLNQRQKDAVNSIEGPVAVIAGPGTGKTELVSMRIANILQQTDTAPENILCLTYTDSGVLAMRQRLLEIIGSTAHKVNIYTFHSFGSTIMSQNAALFFDDVPFRAANSLMTHQVLTDIFETLPHGHILASKNYGEFVKLGRVKNAISHIKQGGLTSEELQVIISNNDIDIDKIEKVLSPVANQNISKKSINAYSSAALKLAEIDRTDLPNATPNLIDVVQNSLLRAIAKADETGKTAPLTQWKGRWFEKDANKNSILKTRSRQAELKAIKQVYEQYVDSMSKERLYDYDDMILMTLAALKNNNELKYNLQERFQYILIDEFQDTNQAQMQIIYQLIDSQLNEDSPNILIVGDDDQAIYGFQGADSSNITTFLEKLPKTNLITLTDNYRSSQKILDHARKIITKGEDRLENSVADLNKELTARSGPAKTQALVNSYPSLASEQQAVATRISELISDGVSPNDITVLARRHDQLIAILPFFDRQQIPVAYDKHDNALDLDSIKMLEQLTDFFLLLNQQKLDDAQALLPEILSHPAWNLAPETLWQISVRAYKERLLWLDTLKTIPETVEIYDWLTKTAATIFSLPIEQALDTLIGGTDQDEYSSPLYNYFFSAEKLKNDPTTYLLHLSALSAVRERLREYLAEDETVNLESFSKFIKLTRTLKESISIKQRISSLTDGSVNLMTAHKAKGLEFEHVFIIDAVDNKWGVSARSGNTTYKFPENIHLNPAGDNLDERIRLFYVAATRAKQSLNISHSHVNEKSKSTLRASFLEGSEWEINDHEPSTDLSELTKQAQAEWSARLTIPNQNLRDLLKPTLQNYKLNSTALNNFIDITRGGPQHFLIQNLLHFPSASSSNSLYGSAIHHALQLAHQHVTKKKQQKPVEDVIADFEAKLKSDRFDKDELAKYLDRGANTLTVFLEHNGQHFNDQQNAEVDFNYQQVVYDNVPLSGKIDVLQKDDDGKTVTITDYKTGKPSDSWKGSSQSDKVKLHKYKQQLMFYHLLLENSRDYQSYVVDDALLSFVEPDKNGEIHALSAQFTQEEYEQFKKLVKAVYSRIVSLDLPDTSGYSEDLKGVLEFENDLTDS